MRTGTERSTGASTDMTVSDGPRRADIQAKMKSVLAQRVRLGCWSSVMPI